MHKYKMAKHFHRGYRENRLTFRRAPWPASASSAPSSGADAGRPSAVIAYVTFPASSVGAVTSSAASRPTI